MRLVCVNVYIIHENVCECAKCLIEYLDEMYRKGYEMWGGFSRFNCAT